MRALSGGAKGKKREIGSERRSFPRLSSFRIAVAVNGFTSEPMSNPVAVVTGRPLARSVASRVS
jgi:hypothetical protein